MSTNNYYEGLEKARHNMSIGGYYKALEMLSQPLGQHIIWAIYGIILSPSESKAISALKLYASKNKLSLQSFANTIVEAREIIDNTIGPSKLFPEDKIKHRKEIDVKKRIYREEVTQLNGLKEKLENLNFMRDMHKRKGQNHLAGADKVRIKKLKKQIKELEEKL